MIQQFLMANLWLIGAAVLSGGMIVWHTFQNGGAHALSPAQAIQRINRDKAVLIDIRDEAAVQKTGLLPDAKRVPLVDLKARADSLAKNKATPLVVVCQNGQRSAAARGILAAAGFSEVHTLAGGAAAWADAGLPLKKAAA